MSATVYRCNSVRTESGRPCRTPVLPGRRCGRHLSPRKPRAKRTAGNVTLRMTLSHQATALVDRLLDTGLYGDTREEALDRLVCERLIQLRGPFLRLPKMKRKR